MPSSSLFLRSSTTLFLYLSMLTVSTYATTYVLNTTYSGSTFFDGFDFFTDADPTHGFVTYVNQSTAQSSGLTKTLSDGSVYIGVDSTNVYNGSAAYSGINGVGRPSVRITSQQKYNQGLFLADIKNMPGGVCGTWPAFWTLGDGTWPYHGEIDIVEGANDMSYDTTSLHTAGVCEVSGTETGTLQSGNCTYDVNTGANSVGCGVTGNIANSYGLGFNSNNGGVYAMQWSSIHINVWFFPRTSIPADITAGTPNPSTWEEPVVNFAGCNIDANFVNHQIVIDNTFCGDWAGNTWSQACAAETGVSVCSNYVG